MLKNLLTEASNPASQSIDQLPTLDMLRVINEEDQRIAGAVGGELPAIAAAVDRIVAAMEKGGRLFYIGAGTSGRLGVLDASECPPTYNVSYDLVQGIIAGGEKALFQATEASEDDPQLGERDLLARGFHAGDVLVGIAASGRTPYVLGAVAKAQAMGAVTIGISCTPNSLLSAAVEIPIAPLVGPEVVTGSTRMKAGTATKLVLNMLSTGAMIRLGHVFGNFMVNVQPKNEKLVDRATRIISEVTGLEHEKAGELLQVAGSVKTALVMADRKVSRLEAERLLEQHNGRVRDAIAR
jgi:N-acetylmuramic acid 6-phosphate etherase